MNDNKVRIELLLNILYMSLLSWQLNNREE